METKKTIEMLEKSAEWIEAHGRNTNSAIAYILSEAAGFISSLDFELEAAKNALAKMWFAYENKDGELPHPYETEAVKTAEEIIGPWEECMVKVYGERKEGAEDG